MCVCVYVCVYVYVCVCVCVCMYVCVCMCKLLLYLLYVQVLRARKRLYMNKPMFSWIEICRLLKNAWIKNYGSNFAQTVDHFELSKRVYGMMHIQKKTAKLHKAITVGQSQEAVHT